MDKPVKKETEYLGLLNDFSDHIRILINKFNLKRYGLDPEDISQDVKIRLWKLICNEKKIYNYSSYIRKIVHSSVIDELRKMRRDDGLYLHEKEKRIEEIKHCYVKEEMRKKNLEMTIGKAVGKLIASRRQAVTLYLLNLNIQEIAGYFGWSNHKTRNLLYRGLSDLRKILQRMDIKYENK